MGVSTSFRRHPAYLAIADELRARIERGELTAGDRLPTERDLVTEFGVARMTVRHALDILQLEGLIDRRRGRTGGTFVRSVPPVVELTRIEGLMPQLRERNLTVESEVLTAARIPAPAHVAQALGLEADDPVLHLIRLRRVEGTPLLLENSFLPEHLVPGLLDEDLTGSLHDLVRDGWGLRPVRKWETITPGIASGWEQETLGVTRNLPLLRLTRTVESDRGDIIQYSEDALRSDIAHIQVVTEDEPLPGTAKPQLRPLAVPGETDRDLDGPLLSGTRA
ncbi:transcriptional regulator [Corynebacterium halotolerans YIM 70093 = DSM 44683]|uniref:Transcriptional regulator n=1 Tax=Corynebacterium halotolerans YIM 70093 = DSM 44683 TaxID=1121362 RepID=M1NUS6_9CORY|nr:transcriptional regulator [Corynebacterium halotolerans YIM 70093 = DSM 44683]